jgi:NAD(P)-dependent dehydrogenase (short-subunit alcohol dehydrogenase family)
MPEHAAAFDISDKVCVVTGGTGALGGGIARGFARHGAKVGVLARSAGAAEKVAAELHSGGGEALALVADVLDVGQLEAARGLVMEKWGRVDVLVNAAGGNQPSATVAPTGTMFDLEPDAFRSVVELNLVGTFLPVLVFGKAMVATGRGSIINISSMTAKLPMSRTAGYGSAKAGVDNLTGWLADHLARQFGQGVRVNAIAPGFFLGDQNRALLTCPDGSFTPRGQAVVSRTPMGRLGDPEDLVGTAVWLASDASAFVTGVVVPVDGGFSAAAGI